MPKVQLYELIESILKEMVAQLDHEREKVAELELLNRVVVN